MSAVLVHADAALRLYLGRAEDCPPEHVDLVFTNPYGPLPAWTHDHPMLIHQWVHRQDEAEAWCGNALTLVGTWNDHREAFWCANLTPVPVDIAEFRPEPGGWYPPEMVRRLFATYRDCRVKDPSRPFTVWDGFMGRGTIGAVARELRMSYVGVEELPAHMALARAYLGLDP